MPDIDRDPVHSVKAFLQGELPAGAGTQASGSLAGDLDLIRERLLRARRIDGRVSASEALQALLAAGETPSA
jgi:hypothetical protein